MAVGTSVIDDRHDGDPPPAPREQPRRTSLSCTMLTTSTMVRNLHPSTRSLPPLPGSRRGAPLGWSSPCSWRRQRTDGRRLRRALDRVCIFEMGAFCWMGPKEPKSPKFWHFLWSKLFDKFWMNLNKFWPNSKKKKEKNGILGREMCLLVGVGVRELSKFCS